MTDTLRVLLLASSYPTVQTPSGAAYLTSRLSRMGARDDVSVDALALVPQYGHAVSEARRRFGALSNEALRLPQTLAGDAYHGVECRWRAADVLAGRRGRVPMALVARVAASVLAHVGARSSDPAPFDVVHAHGMYTLPAGAVAERVAAALEIPFVVSLHGGDVDQIMPRVAGAYREILTRAAATTYVSEALRATAVGLGAPMAGSHVIPNGVDHAVFAPARAEAGDPTRRSDPEAPRLLFVGNLLPVKGADRLPDIIRAVRERLPGATLDIVGDGPLRDALDGETVPGTRCHGRVEPPRVAELMRAASVVVVPSRSEGWGCVISEAYATGTPVVGSDVGGIPEALAGQTAPVPVDGEEPAIARRFAEAIVAVLADPPAPELLTAKVAAQDWDAVVDAELAVLADAATRRGEPRRSPPTR